MVERAENLGRWFQVDQKSKVKSLKGLPSIFDLELSFDLALSDMSFLLLQLAQLQRRQPSLGWRLNT